MKSEIFNTVRGGSAIALTPQHFLLSVFFLLATSILLSPTLACAQFPMLDEMSVLFLKIFFYNLHLVDQSNFYIKSQQKFQQYATREQFTQLINSLQIDCDPAIDQSAALLWQIDMMHQSTQFAFKAKLTPGQNPQELTQISFAFSAKTGTDLTSIFKDNFFSFLQNELLMESLINGFFMTAVMDSSVKTLDIMQMPRIFADLQHSADMDGYQKYSLRRAFARSNLGRGLYTNMIEGEDVIFFDWKKIVATQKNSLTLQMHFQLQPQLELPADFEEALVHSICEEEHLSRNYFIGFEGVQIGQSPIQDESGLSVIDGEYLFDLHNSLPNRSKLSQLGSKFGPLSNSAQKLTEKYLLGRLLTADLGSVPSEQLKDTQSQLDSKVEGAKILLTTEKVLSVATFLIRRLNPEVFDNLELVKAEREMAKRTQNTIQLLQLTSESHPKGTVKGKFVSEDQVFEYRLIVKFNEECFDHRKIPAQLLTTIVQLNSCFLRFKNVPFSADVFGKYSTGNMVLLEFYYDQTEFHNFSESWQQFFTFGSEVNTSVSISDLAVNVSSTVTTVFEANESEDSERSDEVVSAVSSETPIEHTTPSHAPSKIIKPIISSQSETTQTIDTESASKDSQDESQGDQIESSQMPDRADLVAHFPFDLYYSEFLKLPNIPQRHVDKQNLKLAKYLAALFLSSVVEHFFPEGECSDDHFMWLTVKQHGNKANLPIHNFSFEEMQIALLNASVDIRIVEMVEIDSRLFDQVDQITFSIKLAEGVYFLVFRFSRRDASSFHTETLHFQFFVLLSGSEQKYEAPDMNALEAQKLNPEPISVWHSLIVNRMVMYNLLEKIDFLVFKRSEEIPELFFYNDSDSPEFEHEEKGLEGEPSFIYDQSTRTYLFDVVTAPIAKRVQIPNLPDRPTGQRFEYSDFSSDNHYKAKVRFDTVDLALDPSKNNYDEYQKMTIVFKFEFGACPVEFETFFKFTDETTCRKIFSEGRYMVEFRDAAALEGDFDVPIEESLRMYLLWPDEVEGVEDGNLVQSAQESQIDEVDSSSFGRNLVYRFILNRSVHLEKFLYAENEAENSEKALREIAEVYHQKFKDTIHQKKSKIKPPIIKSKKIVNLVKAIVLHENSALTQETGFTDLMKNPVKKNRSEFENFQHVVKVLCHKHSANFGELKKVKVDNVYRLKVELDSYAYKGTTWADYLNNPSNADFLGKMTYLENYEKYKAYLSKYEQFDLAQMRFNFGQQASIHLVEGLDQLWVHMRKKKLLI